MYTSKTHRLFPAAYQHLSYLPWMEKEREMGKSKWTLHDRCQLCCLLRCCWDYGDLGATGEKKAALVSSFLLHSLSRRSLYKNNVGNGSGSSSLSLHGVKLPSLVSMEHYVSLAEERESALALACYAMMVKSLSFSVPVGGDCSAYQHSKGLNSSQFQYVGTNLYLDTAYSGTKETKKTKCNT